MKDNSKAWFPYFCTKTYHDPSLESSGEEALMNDSCQEALMSGHNKCFCLEIIKIILELSSKNSILSGS